MRLSALEGLQRGILSLRANWELIFLVWVQTALMLLLSLAALLPFYLVLDVRLPALDAAPEESASWFLDSLTRIHSELDSLAFWLAVVSSSAILLAMLACYSFFQAGVFGVLTTADRQAPPGGRTETAWFRTYSWVEFQGRGGRQLWRFFWLINLMFLFWLVWVVFASVAAVAGVLVTGGAGLSAGLAVGCASILPLGFLFVLLFFWSLFGEADIADSDCSAWDGLRGGLRVLVRRLGAVFLLFVLMAFASVAIGMVFLVLSFPLSTGLVPHGALQLTATLFLQALQWLAAGVVQLTIVGAVVAILRNERALESEAHARSAP